MAQSSTRISDLPHYRISPVELASWLEDQSDDSWWSVDGDPYLTGQIGFPCPGDKLAAVLRRTNNRLLLFDARSESTADGDSIPVNELDALSIRNSNDERVFRLCWENSPDNEWLLVEDREIVKSFDDGEADE